MLKEDLLDKSEQVLTRLIEKLYLAENALPKQQLVQELQISLSTLNRYGRHLQEDLQAYEPTRTASLMNTGTTLQFNTKGQLSVEQFITETYVQKSINYRLLVLIYQQPGISMFNLANGLNISEASLYRRLKQIRPILAEFKLTVQNGQLIGSELQVRYFYYCLFGLSSYPVASTPAVHDFIHCLQEELGFTFSKSARRHVNRWLQISNRRARQSVDMDSTIPTHIRELYQNNVLYGKVQHCFQQFFKVTRPFEVESLCTMLISLAVFNSKNQVVSRFSLINRKNQTRLNQIVRHIEAEFFAALKITSDEWSFELSKFLFDICARPYCFTGTISNFDQQYAQYYETTIFSANVSQLVNVIHDRLLKSSRPQLRNLVQNNWLYFDQSFHLVLREFQYQQRREIFVGLDTNLNAHLERILREELEQQFRTDLNVIVMLYQPGYAYDLVVTNTATSAYDDADRTYWIANLGNQSDIKNIHDLIHQNYYDGLALERHS
ncbi:helix-turn-helix domain-containing protein [Loigolactobacillus backii]|uniref:helix-turn-helix domain-containing protein n=2 Tax=Loigolactobacillus backii TaxID=375175 RepID=UPI0007F1441F|nr:helix-turn-helix domain-containing protein [Loigolactobacillus backii]ANK59552.1 hypothetical protein AYR52_04390 [Loigolactobacillus backii]ANK67058.1 hypothetical protein AYR55_04635 [Loigolactobacillus backii]OLF70697.1 hypothetical protein ACX53_01065 [Loigolactobacillus backii]PIO87703.1 hypothetical protein B8A32_11395 [Loigolactobacillus backii]